MFSEARKQADSLSDLIDAALAEISDLNDPNGPAAEAHRLARLRDETEKRNCEIRGKLADCSCTGAMGPGTLTRYDPGADAQALLDGADIATLTAPVEESARAGLLRQHRAAKALLDQLPDRLRQMNYEVAAAEYEKIKPAVTKVMRAVLDEYERLAGVLELLQKFDHELNRRGLGFEMRGPLLTGYDSWILGGGNGRPTLRWWVENQRKQWQIDDNKGR